MSIKQDAVVGQAVPIEGKPIVLAQEENTSETETLHRARRIDFQTKEEVANGTTLTTARMVMGEGNMTLPEHLVDLHNRATQDLGPGEGLKVAELLNRYDDCFSKSEWDLGLSHLIEHEIKTDDKATTQKGAFSICR